jgi:hypothetical protein
MNASMVSDSLVVFGFVVGFDFLVIFGFAVEFDSVVESDFVVVFNLPGVLNPMERRLLGCLTIEIEQSLYNPTPVARLKVAIYRHAY